MLGAGGFWYLLCKKKNVCAIWPPGKKDGELYIGAFLLSEPEAGSDATSQKTTAIDNRRSLCIEWHKKLDYQWKFSFGLSGDGTNRRIKG